MLLFREKKEGEEGGARMYVCIYDDVYVRVAGLRKRERAKVEVDGEQQAGGNKGGGEGSGGEGEKKRKKVGDTSN